MNRRGFFGRLFAAGAVAAMPRGPNPYVNDDHAEHLAAMRAYESSVCGLCRGEGVTVMRWPTPRFRQISFDGGDLGRGGESYVTVPCAVCRKDDHAAQLGVWARMVRREEYELNRRRYRAAKRDPARLPL